MHRPGHYGAALLTYAPLGLFVAVAGHEAAAIVGCAVTLGLTTLPDYDQRLPVIDHRGPTHTIGFALLVGTALAGLVSGLVTDASAGWGTAAVAFAFLLGTLSICSHLLADALTPAGIRPFWPLSNRRYSLSIARASSPVANYVLFGLGLLATGFAAVSVSQFS